jgi:hypothetical protein
MNVCSLPNQVDTNAKYEYYIICAHHAWRTHLQRSNWPGRPDFSKCMEMEEPFGYADKSVEKHYWLIYCERKILFQLKKQIKKNGL